MKVGQRVRFKPTSGAARYWKIPHDAQGTVMCSYRLLASNRAAPDRLDVRFTPQLVIWAGLLRILKRSETFRNGQCNNLLHVAVRSSCDQDSPCLCISHSGVTLI